MTVSQLLSDYIKIKLKQSKRSVKYCGESTNKTLLFVGFQGRDRVPYQGWEDGDYS